MRQFDFYEFAAILAPGTLSLLGLSLAYPGGDVLGRLNNLSVGGLGVVVILAYVAGHLTQAIGNFIESLWWKAWSGMPTDWIRTGKSDLLDKAQIDKLNLQLQTELALSAPVTVSALSANSWLGLTRQVYAAIAGKKRSARVDTFNGNYGLCRGIAAALTILLCLVLFERSIGQWKVVLALSAGLLVSLYRMHLFAKHYARELFVQFLQLSHSGGREKEGR